ncbi:hypothetical protein GE061_018849 [Apolygus lucorum]|uniref:Uncharacterized protein n=1 Tax=Apolygus lucorum TaxID=248454 RepID=A0A8S9X8J8_APOLU|nr:hypothetical protein GE061_018849 [Apolygus lucorum]
MSEAKNIKDSKENGISTYFARILSRNTPKNELADDTRTSVGRRCKANSSKNEFARLFWMTGDNQPIGGGSLRGLVLLCPHYHSISQGKQSRSCFMALKAEKIGK